uniref:Peptidase S54 rhomboid domain-containing protein n=1 Tax=Chromera velia CCMP2878 TaxID=1169474 RepID=A0A0G4GQ36_9ALVE|eukprot:Cvel_5041.t1-p1 / transcript=Cvel_5041.t1 / gene=Cvel_5041 / organism=Chromera_velia_CCMP2878 / gene_product=hypothetical protein / transcript_product=hypothetical protein / location=Cvel_scaffold229:92185-94567(-) / protein_length=325 / sequence_SO=supercontig / SO=protein_coding / is_pseudo=false
MLDKLEKLAKRFGREFRNARSSFVKSDTRRTLGDFLRSQQMKLGDVRRQMNQSAQRGNFKGFSGMNKLSPLSRNSSQFSRQLTEYSEKARDWWERCPYPTTVKLMGMNCGVFLLWCIAKPPRVDLRSGRVQNQGLVSSGFMHRNFTLTAEGFKRGYLHTLALSSISHNDIRHLGFNMLFLFFVGRSFETLNGGLNLMRAFWGAALAGALSNAVMLSRQQKRLSGINYEERMLMDSAGIRAGRYTPGHVMGAEAGLAGLMTMLCLRNPWSEVYIWFVLPVPMIAFLGLLTVVELIRAGQEPSAVGNLTAIATGTIFHWAKFRRWFF